MKHYGYALFLLLITAMLLFNFYPDNNVMYIFVLIIGTIASGLIIVDSRKTR